MYFTKLQGCGNDYILLDGGKNGGRNATENRGELARLLCDRHYGIGADGLLFVQPGKKAPFEMEMYNPDGSRAEMCGNGIRCVGKYIWDNGLTKEREFKVESLGVVRSLRMLDDREVPETLREDRTQRGEFWERQQEEGRSEEGQCGKEYQGEGRSEEGQCGEEYQGEGRSEEEQCGEEYQREGRSEEGQCGKEYQRKECCEKGQNEKQKRKEWKRAGGTWERERLGKKVRYIQVDMGAPGEIREIRIEGEHDAGMEGKERTGLSWREGDSMSCCQRDGETGGRILISCVSMGNPHAVLLLSEEVDWQVETLGPLIEKAKAFPDRTNVEFVKVLGRNRIALRVWERGVGETLACGTGACAAAVVCMQKGLTDEKITVTLLGGRLLVSREASTGHVLLTGPAETVFEGKL